MNLQGIRAIVTGAASGIGLATVKALLHSGASHVGLLARSQQKIDGALATIDSAEERGRVLPLLADVREPETLSKAFQSFLQAADGLDVLVNNAGVLLDGALLSFSFRGVERYSLENWQTTLETNLRGVFLCSQLAVEHMFRKRCKGVIVNISSISRQGRAGQTAYSASKGGMASVTFTLAQELAPYGIRCVAIAPGLVDTPMAANIPEEARKKMLDHVALGRMGRPDEIAHGVLFCIENDFFNGRVLELDGGPLGP
jgi:3-oxoacyl-[acyl-carrier protein] reductase